MKAWAGSGRWRRLLPVFLCGAKVDGGIKEIGLCGENWTLIGVELCKNWIAKIDIWRYKSMDKVNRWLRLLLIAEIMA